MFFIVEVTVFAVSVSSDGSVISAEVSSSSDFRVPFLRTSSVSSAISDTTPGLKIFLRPQLSIDSIYGVYAPQSINDLYVFIADSLSSDALIHKSREDSADVA